MDDDAIITDSKQAGEDEPEAAEEETAEPEEEQATYTPIEHATTTSTKPRESILDFSKVSNLFNQKEFSEIRDTIHQIKGLLDTERDNEKKLLADLTDLLERERATKKTKETKLRTHLQKINAKVLDINTQTVEKEGQLKKEIDILQSSIRAIQQNLSAFGLVAKPKPDQPGQTSDNKPSLIDKKELEGITSTLTDIKRLLDEEREREKQIETDLDALVSRREESKIGKENKFKDHVQGIVQRIAKITQQTIEKEAKLKRETEILQSSIRLIRSKLPMQDDNNASAAASFETVSPATALEDSQAYEAPSAAAPELDFEGGSPAPEGEDDKKGRKRKFGKGFYTFKK